jgi:hypothetical protein
MNCKVKEKLTETYYNYLIKSNHFIYEDNSRLIEWKIYKEGILLLRDIRTCDGSNLQSCRHAINDAKSNIDTLIKLGKWTINK